VKPYHSGLNFKFSRNTILFFEKALSREEAALFWETSTSGTMAGKRVAPAIVQ